MAGGLGFDVAKAGAIYGSYTSMVYLTNLPGGWIADRLIGQRRAVLYRRHPDRVRPLQHGRSIAGDVLSRPSPDRHRHRAAEAQRQRHRRSAVSARRSTAGRGVLDLLHGHQPGRVLSPLVCGYLGQRVNWHVGFAAAGVGMVLGLVQYVLGGRHLGDRRAAPRPCEVERGRCEQLAPRDNFIGGGGVALVAFVVLLYAGVLPITPTQIANAAGYLLLVTTVVFFGGCSSRPTGRRRNASASTSLACSSWQPRCSGRNSSRRDRRSTSSPIARRGRQSSARISEQLVPVGEPLFIITFAPVFAWLWIALGRREPSSPTKFSFGLIGVGLGFLLLVPRRSPPERREHSSARCG